jgi:hypothetical protein
MRQHFNFWGIIVNSVFFLAYVLWLLGVLMLAWGTVPYLISPWVIVPPPPEWLSSFARLVFYRDYIF